MYASYTLLNQEPVLAFGGLGSLSFYVDSEGSLGPEVPSTRHSILDYPGLWKQQDPSLYLALDLLWEENLSHCMPCCVIQPAMMVLTCLHLPFLPGILILLGWLTALVLRKFRPTVGPGWANTPNTAPTLKPPFCRQLWTTPTQRGPWACGLRAADSSLTEAGHPEAQVTLHVLTKTPTLTSKPHFSSSR